jgi:hypothetical protein
MKKAAWIFFMAAAGWFIGSKSDYPGQIPWGGLIGAAWSGGVGYGLGTIFDTKNLNRPIVAAWTIVGALIGILVGAIEGSQSLEWQFDIAMVAGGFCGGAVGYAIGRRQRLKHRGH